MSPEHRDEKLRQKWQELRARQDKKTGVRERRVKGEFWQEWIEFLRPFNITYQRARQIVKGPIQKPGAPFNESHARRCIDYLTKHGYDVKKR